MMAMEKFSSESICSHVTSQVTSCDLVLCSCWLSSESNAIWLFVVPMLAILLVST